MTSSLSFFGNLAVDDALVHQVSMLSACLFRCVTQENEQLARSGVNCLENLVISNGPKLEEATWERICCCINDIFHLTLPQSLLVWNPNAAAQNDELKDTHRLFNSLLVQCLVQLELIHTIDNIVFFPSTTRKEDADLLASAKTSAVVIPASHRDLDGISISNLSEN
jgi:brefeldin A-inhibited guanine nucleotide-exchange protein